MVQVINKPTLASSIGSSIGEGLGTGIGQGLRALAQTKFNQLSQRNSHAQLSRNLQGLGLSPEESSYLAQLPPKEQWDAVRTFFQGGGGGQMGPVEPQETSYINQLLTTLDQPSTDQGALGSPITPEILAPQGLGRQYQRSSGVVQEPKREVYVPGPRQKEKPLKPEAVVPESQVITPEPKKRVSLAEASRRPIVSEKAARTDQYKANKETQKYYDQILAEDKAAKSGDIRLQRMEKLINEGSLPISTFYNAINGLKGIKTGIPVIGTLIDALISPVGGVLSSLQRGVTAKDTEEFEKLSDDFVKDAKNFFGGRLTDTDLEQFMKTIPRLSQTDSGKRAVIRNMRIMNEMAHIRSEVMKQIIKEEGGRPTDLAIQVEEIAEPALDRLAQEFIAPVKEVAASEPQASTQATGNSSKGIGSLPVFSKLNRSLNR